MAATYKQVADAFKKRRLRLLPAMVEATHEATELLFESSKKHLNTDVYGKSIPRLKSKKKRDVTFTVGGKKKTVRTDKEWVRTGNLRRSEKFRVIGVNGFITNNAKAEEGGGGYAHARHNLGLASGNPKVIPPPPRKKRKTDREAPWRADAIADTEEKRLDIYRSRILRVMRETRV